MDIDNDETLRYVREMILTAVPDKLYRKFKNRSAYFKLKKFGTRPLKSILAFTIANYLVKLGFITKEQAVTFYNRPQQMIEDDLQSILDVDDSLNTLRRTMPGTNVSGSASAADVTHLLPVAINKKRKAETVISGSGIDDALVAF